MKDYLSLVISPMLENPQALEIVETQDEKGIFLSVNISKPDMGRVIGKGGDNIEAIRTIMRTAASLKSLKASIKINEPEKR